MIFSLVDNKGGKEKCMSIGKRISQARKEINVSQEKLAELINASRQSISKWESNQVIPDTENLIALAKALSVSVEWIISGKHHDNKKKNYMDHIVLIIGIIFFLISVILIISFPQIVSETSSVITFNGFSILVVVSVIIIFLGIVLAYKKK